MRKGEINASCIDQKKGTFRADYYSGIESLDIKTYCQKLKDEAKRMGLTQSRLCLHDGDKELVHIMLVYHSDKHEVRKHVHHTKEEYLILIKGHMQIHSYNTNGDLTHINELESRRVGINWGSICKIPAGAIHRVLLLRETWFIEVTKGPFDSTSTIFT